MHYSFDKWISIKFPQNKLERYEDDGVTHCYIPKQAIYIMDKLKKRMRECGLEIHLGKSGIICCSREKNYKNNSFDFLGYTFRRRLVKSRKGEYFIGFTPVVSKIASKRFRGKIKEEIRKTNTTDIMLLAKSLNPIIIGWMNYFMKFNSREAIRTGINYVNLILDKWLKKTHKSVRNSIIKAQILLMRISKSSPNMFYHW